MQVMSLPSATFSPSTVASDVAVMFDLDSMSDIECGQPDEDYAKEAILCAQALETSDSDDDEHKLANDFAMRALDASDDDTNGVTGAFFMPVDDSMDLMYIYKAKVHDIFDGVVPDYDYAHSSSRMFGKRGSSFRYPSFEFWRRQFDMCRFNIILLTGSDDYNQWVDDRVLNENIEMKYICPHKTRSRHATDRCRVRPVCCDAYNRSCCWVDLSATFHGSYGILSCATIGANAPIPSFDVGCASLHPITRTREYFHCGTSFNYPVAECNRIDTRAINELSFAFKILRRFAKYLPVVWCEIMLMLNPYEKMIFASMMHDGNAIDDHIHQLRCNRLYGYNMSAHEHSLFVGHKESRVNSNSDLRLMMNNRSNSPCQQLMRYGGAYDLTNMLNRHAIRVEIVSEWRYLLLDIGRIMLHHIRFYCPDHAICWTVCSYEEKTRYVNTWRAVLRYLEIMSYRFTHPGKDSLQFMMSELDDIIRHFIDTDGLFSYLMSNNSVIRLAACADISDITWMAWEESHDVRTLMNLKDWNSGFRTLMCQTMSYLEVDMIAVRDIVEIGIVNSEIEHDMTACDAHVKWRGLLARVVEPIVQFWQTYR